MEDGAVVSLWRYPVKSMMGEELNASELTDRGLLGDRSLASADTETETKRAPADRSHLLFRLPLQISEILNAVAMTLDPLRYLG